MLDRVRRWLGSPDALIRAARGPDRRVFVKLFCRSPIRCICLPKRFAEGLPANASREEILAQIEAAARDLSERESFSPFSYLREGQRRMPLFTSEELAADFAKAYALDVQCIVPLQVLAVDGVAVVPSFKDCDVVVLNDRTSQEYVLSVDDMALLKGATGA